MAKFVILMQASRRIRFTMILLSVTVRWSLAELEGFNINCIGSGAEHERNQACIRMPRILGFAASLA